VRIVQDTPSRLILRDRTLWSSVICLGGAAILVGHFALRGGAAAEQLLPAALSVLFGLAFLHATDVHFDKILRTCAITRLDVVRLTRRRLSFDDIVDVRIDISRFPDGDEAGCRFSIVTSSGAIPLTAAYEPDPERYSAMRSTLLDMLLDSAPHRRSRDQVETLVQEGRIVDAVAILRMRDGLSLTDARTRVAELQTRLGGEMPGR
jgi:hypothetical protein